MADDLPFRVERWTRDGQHVEQVLARASNVLIARAAFQKAAAMDPAAILTLRHGARVIEAQNTSD